MVILSWFENRPSDEIPNENLWEDPKGLEEWWDRIKARKEYGSSSGSGHSHDSGGKKDDEVVENEFAAQFKQ